MPTSQTLGATDATPAVPMRSLQGIGAEALRVTAARYGYDCTMLSLSIDQSQRPTAPMVDCDIWPARYSGTQLLSGDAKSALQSTITAWASAAQPALGFNELALRWTIATTEPAFHTIDEAATAIPVPATDVRLALAAAAIRGDLWAQGADTLTVRIQRGGGILKDDGITYDCGPDPTRRLADASAVFAPSVEPVYLEWLAANQGLFPIDTLVFGFVLTHPSAHERTRILAQAQRLAERA